jgi:uncharacterized protein (TIGR03435 family)
LWLKVHGRQLKKPVSDQAIRVGIRCARAFPVRLSVRVLYAIALLTGAVRGEHSGDLPPALVWNKTKGNCPASLDWLSLRGNVVVVSLTAESVFPDDITDWNDVAGKFQGEPVVFIQVVAGSEFLLDAALDQTPFQGCILLDTDSRNHQNFKLPPYERTVVVDETGVIAGYSPDDPDEDAIRAVLNHEPYTALLETPPQPQWSKPAAGPDPVPSYAVRISPAQPGELRWLGTPERGSYVSQNQPLKLIILTLWDTPTARIVFPEHLDEARYDVTAHIPAGDSDALPRLLREAVERYFGLRIEKEERMQPIYVLTALSKSPRLQPAANGDDEMCGGGQGSIEGTARTLTGIAAALEGQLNVPVVDETGLQGKYNYAASSKLAGREAAIDMAHQLGLQLTPAERLMEMLVVRLLVP